MFRGNVKAGSRGVENWRFGVLVAIEFQQTVLGKRQTDYDWLSDILFGLEMARYPVPSFADMPALHHGDDAAGSTHAKDVCNHKYMYIVI
jgi:hypothetical protein